MPKPSPDPDSGSPTRRITPMCPACHRLLRLEAPTCPHCGTRLISYFKPLQPGQPLANGRYTVQRSLSKGAMGALYLATDHEAFDRLVVVKVMLDSPDIRSVGDAQSARQRFTQEARTLAALRHPTIPAIFGYFQDGSQSCIVMEYIEGDDLEHALSSSDPTSGQSRPGRPYARQDVLRWGVALCQTLEYLARQQPCPVVHQDIKPANLVLDCSSNQIHLVDFGTAHSRMVHQPDGTVRLRQSETFGTQGYAPPEQYRGQSEPRSDVYALAATLYHLATDDDPSEHPFDFPLLPTLGTLGEVLASALHRDITRRPTAAELRQQLETLLTPARIRPIQTPDGTVVNDEPELVAWCEQHWARAKFWLYDRLPQQIEVFWGKTRLANDISQVIRYHSDDRDAGLDAVLAMLDPQGFGSEQQQLATDRAALNFGAISTEHHGQRSLVLVNQGRRYIQAHIMLPDWLTVNTKTLGLPPGEQATLRLSTALQHTPLYGGLSDSLRVAHEQTPLAEVHARASTSRWLTLWQRYPLPLAAVLVVLLGVLFGGAGWLHQESSATSHYHAGRAALDRGAWETARSELAAVANYRDSARLLQESYYQAGIAALEREDWQAARQEFTQVPDYRDTPELLQESYYQAGIAALEREDWQAARQEFTQVLHYRDADMLLHESYYRAGQAALERKDWNDARGHLLQVVGYRDSAELLQESYYRAGQAALEREDWTGARGEFAQVPDYRDTPELLQKSRYQAGKAALERHDWQAARSDLEQVADYRDAERLLKESYYRPLLQAIETEHWDTAADLAMKLQTLDHDYRDLADLPAQHPPLLQTMGVRQAAAWQQGKARSSRVIHGHSETVQAVAFSPDGRTLATGGWDKAVHLWWVADGEPVRSLEGHERYVSSVAFSPEGQLLASSSADGTIRLWRVDDGELLRTLNGHDNFVVSVAFSPDGSLLASGSWDQTIGLWRVEDGALLARLRGHSGVVESVAFSPDGSLLASGGWDNLLALWQVEDGALVWSQEGHDDHISSIAFSPDGSLLASGSLDTTIKLWQVADGSLQRRLIGHRDGVRSIAFSVDGRVLASGSGGLSGIDTSIRLWQVADGTPLQILQGHSGWVYSMDFSPDGRILASGSFDETVRLWQAQP